MTVEYPRGGPASAPVKLTYKLDGLVSKNTMAGAHRSREHHEGDLQEIRTRPRRLVRTCERVGEAKLDECLPGHPDSSRLAVDCT